MSWLEGNEIAKTHNPYKFLMLVLPCNFSNLFIARTRYVFAIKSLMLGAGGGDGGDYYYDDYYYDDGGGGGGS